MSSVKRVAFIALILAMATGTLLLSRWQLRRLATRRASNATFLAARALPPLTLPSTPFPATIDSGRRLIVRGAFDTTEQIFLRERAEAGQPGLQVATAFRIDSSTRVLWVLRGFVSSPDAVTPPSSVAAGASGTVSLTGLALALPVTNDSGYPLMHNGSTTWQRLDRATLQRRDSASLPVYLLLAADSVHNPGGLAVVPPTELTDGPHLSYAIQWAGITLAILSFGVLILWRDGHAPARRREGP